MANLRSKAKWAKSKQTKTITEHDALGLDQAEDVISKTNYTKYGYPWVPRLKAILLFAFLHIGGVVGLVLLPRTHLLTLLWGKYGGRGTDKYRHR